MRQSELGEFDPEFPSSLGPVTEYHGTIDMQNVLDRGIRGGSPARRSRRYVPESLRGEDRISYTTNNRDLALQFAQERAKKLGLPASNVGVVGIRGGGLPNAVTHQEPAGGVFAGTQSNVRAGGIPRSNIVPVVKSEKKKKKPAFALIISVGPKMPKKPEDTADPDKEVKKSDAYVQVSASCDCCSPSTQAFGTLVEHYFEKSTAEERAMLEREDAISGSNTLPIRPQLPGGGMYYRNEIPPGPVRNARRRMMREDEQEANVGDEEFMGFDLDPYAEYIDPREEAQNHRDMILEMLRQGKRESKPLTIGDFPLKAQKKSKPFHGYNPKRHHKKGGLNAAGRAKFKRETGANLKPPVTTKPSKLKPGSKRAKRRKSFCARMSGSKGPTSKDGKLTPKGAALKRWNC